MVLRFRGLGKEGADCRARRLRYHQPPGIPPVNGIVLLRTRSGQVHRMILLLTLLSLELLGFHVPHLLMCL